MQYEIIYKRIKNGYAKIQHDGSVQITIPYILRNNKKFEQALLLQAEKLRTKQQQKTKIHSRNAESLYLFGEDIALEDIEIANLRVNSKRDKYELFFQQTLLEYVEPLVAEYSTKIGYTYTSISIKRLTSKRGSCSHDQKLVFNLDLVHVPTRLIQYVVIHEICHLKEKNHSARFWTLVETLSPNYKKLRKELRDIIIHHK